MREEQLDKKKIATQKFEIKIFTTSNKIITSIEDGLLYYFNNLTYVNDCYNLYKITIQNEINEINNEVQQLRQIRVVKIYHSISVQLICIAEKTKRIFK